MLFVILSLAIVIPSLILMIYLSSSYKKRFLTFLVIPYVLGSVYFVWYYLESIKGYPTKAMPENFQFLYSYEDAPKSIYLWVYDLDEKAVKTVVIPWKEPDAKKASMGNQSVKQGFTVERRKGNEKRDANGVEYDDSQFTLHNLDMGSRYKK